MSKKYNAVANAGQNASQTFVKGAAILTVSMIVVKVFGVLDKVILTNIYSMFGESLASMGMGIYNNAYEVFGVIFIVATGGLPIVISRMISQSMAEERYKDVRQIHRLSIPLFLVVGLVCTIGLMIISFPYAFNFIKSPYSIYAMLALAPTVLFGCIASIYRGYFEGQRNMFPTAVSEVIEAVVKLVLGALFAFLIMYFGMAHYRDTGEFLWFRFRDHNEAQNTILAFSVAGNICGISLASLSSSIFLILKYKIGGDGIPREFYEKSVTARRQKETLAVIVKTALPIVGGALVMSIGSLIDAVIIQNVLFNLAKNNADALARQYSDYYPREVFYPYGSVGLLRLLADADAACHRGDAGIRLQRDAQRDQRVDKGRQGGAEGLDRHRPQDDDDVHPADGVRTLCSGASCDGVYLFEPRYHCDRRQRTYPHGRYYDIHGDYHADLQHAQRHRQGQAADDPLHCLHGRQNRYLMDFRQHARYQHSGRDGRLADFLRADLRGGNVPADQAFQGSARLPFDDGQAADSGCRLRGDGVLCEHAD